MPNVDDHGLEVLKKAARNIGATPKTDYALQTILVADESGSGGAGLTPSIQNISVAVKDIETEITLPVNCKNFILKARKISRLKLAYTLGGTNTEWITIPKGGYWVEKTKIATDKVYIQSSIDDNLIEVISYV